jgi:hypothetical protein
MTAEIRERAAASDKADASPGSVDWRPTPSGDAPPAKARSKQNIRQTAVRGLLFLALPTGVFLLFQISFSPSERYDSVEAALPVQVPERPRRTIGATEPDKTVDVALPAKVSDGPKQKLAGAIFLPAEAPERPRKAKSSSNAEKPNQQSSAGQERDSDDDGIDGASDMDLSSMGYEGYDVQCRQSLCNCGSVINPYQFGAKGDGVVDDTEAVLATFRYAIQCEQTRGVIIGPGGLFSVTPGYLEVRLDNLDVEFDGYLVGPSNVDWNPANLTWPPGSCAYGEPRCFKLGAPHPEYARTKWALLSIVNSSNVNIHGVGGLRAPGWTFWPARTANPALRAYCLLKIVRSSSVTISQINLLNSPSYHLILMHCSDIRISWLNVAIDILKVRIRKSVGKWGPANTDGVSIFASQQVHLSDSRIGSGDDGVVCKSGTRGVLAERLLLDSGKGVAIGSLGENGEHDVVSNITFRDIVVQGARHGVRVKIWRGTQSALQDAIFDKFQISSAKFGVFVDQGYCPLAQRPEGCQDSDVKRAMLAMQNVVFKNFEGTYLGGRGSGPVQNAACDGCAPVRIVDSKLEQGPVELSQAVLQSIDL